MEYHGTSQIAIVGNKIERGIVIPMIRSWTMLVSVKQREKYFNVYSSMTKRTS
jgi:hypothetical protein